MTAWNSPELPTREAVIAWAESLPGKVDRIVAWRSPETKLWRASASTKETT